MDRERGLTQRSLRQHSSTEEYLDAVREDLAEWLSTMYPSLGINSESFFSKLETGVVLCNHTNRLIDRLNCPRTFLPCRTCAQPATFQARDNLCNFLKWCRQANIKDCLLFETDDLVLRKNDKNVLLCIMEVARMGAKLGLPAPTLIQLEKEIDADAACNSSRELDRDDVASSVSSDSLGSSLSDGDNASKLPGRNLPAPYLKNIDQVVDERVKVCRCSTPFPLTKVSPGKYRIGPTQLTIYVRILRNHVMVRVGGGWDTLDHFLEKHDPCRRGGCACLVPSQSHKAGSPVPHSLPSAVPVKPQQRRHSTTNLTALRVLYRSPSENTSTAATLPINNGRSIKRRHQTIALTPIRPPKQPPAPKSAQSQTISEKAPQSSRTRSRMQNLPSRIPSNRSSGSASQPPAPVTRTNSGSTKSDPWENAMHRHREEFLRTKGIFESLRPNNVAGSAVSEDSHDQNRYEATKHSSTSSEAKNVESAEEGFFSDASSPGDHSTDLPTGEISRSLNQRREKANGEENNRIKNSSQTPEYIVNSAVFLLSR